MSMWPNVNVRTVPTLVAIQVLRNTLAQVGWWVSAFPEKSVTKV